MEEIFACEPTSEYGYRNNEMNLAWQFISGTGVSVFLTGKAGTGKTTFLRKLRELMPKRMVVLAPTGVAAINAGGQTIHSFFQFAPGPYNPGADPYAGEKSHKFAANKLNLIRTLDLLVIDEISMVRADLLDRIDAALRKFRRSPKPFGGLQLLMIGDLMQLSPVTKSSEWQLLSEQYSSPYFFASQALGQMQYITVELHHIYRQQDPTFINILARVRTGNIDTASIDALNARFRPGFIPSEPGWIRLTTHNNTANEYNSTRLASLTTHPTTYRAKIKDDFPEGSYPADRKLTLKAGAQVMFIKNDSVSGQHLYFNGKIGIVTALYSDHIEVKCPDDAEPISVFPEVWKNVKYSLNPDSGDIEEKVEGEFAQFPLRLAWAITVHKSQGLTFDHAVLDINTSFTHGQAYVALSRCRSLEGLVLSSPIATHSVITDRNVESYINKATELARESASHLGTYRMEYMLALLDDLYSFSHILRAANSLVRVLEENLSNDGRELTTDLQHAIDCLVDKVMTITGKFTPVYHAAISAAQGHVNGLPILDRIQKSCKYFADTLSSIFPSSLLVDKAALIINNKQTLQAYNNALTLLRTVVADKLAILQKMSAEPFSVSAYLTAKAKAMLQSAPAQSTTKRTSKKAPKEKKPKAQRGDSARLTVRKFLSGSTPQAIAEERSLNINTVYGHLLDGINDGMLTLDQVVAPTRQKAILTAFYSYRKGHPGAFSYGDLLPLLPGYNLGEIAITIRKKK